MKTVTKRINVSNKKTFWRTNKVKSAESTCDSTRGNLKRENEIGYERRRRRIAYNRQGFGGEVSAQCDRTSHRKRWIDSGRRAGPHHGRWTRVGRSPRRSRPIPGGRASRRWLATLRCESRCGSRHRRTTTKIAFDKQKGYRHSTVGNHVLPSRALYPRDALPVTKSRHF